MNESDRNYSARIIKAGALLADTKAFLQAYDENQSVAGNLRRLRSANVFGKASRHRVAEILPVFRHRYCDDDSLARPLRTLARSGVTDDVLDRVLYYHTARADPLLYDFALRYLGSLQTDEGGIVRPADARQVVVKLLREAGLDWVDGTVRRVTQGLLSTLRDFRALTGHTRKRLGTAHLPLEAFAYVAFAIGCDGVRGERLVSHPVWRLYLLSAEDVERLFVQAQQRRWMSFHSAGRLVRIDFGFPTLEGLVDAIVA